MNKFKAYIPILKIIASNTKQKIVYYYNHKYTLTYFLLFLVCILIVKNYNDLYKNRDISYLDVYKSQKNIYILDSGHGKPKRDNCSNKAVREPNGNCFYEWEYNFKVVNEICKMLDKRGIFYLRTDSLTDQRDLGVMKRVEFINTIASDLKKSSLPQTEVLVLSIHANGSSKNTTAQGLEIFTNLEKADRFFDESSAINFKGQTIALIDILHNFYRQYLPSTEFRYASGNLPYKESDRAAEGDIAILKRTKTYAVLTENGFFTNPAERELMKTDEWIRKIALVHVNTILTIENLDLYEN